MQLKKGQEIEVKIEKLAFGGEGLGEFDGRKVFIGGTIPGDTVRASFTKIKPNYAHAELKEIIQQSPQRIKPKCKHFFNCGGCQLQYLPYQDQLDFKEDHVKDCITRIGKISDFKFNKIIPCQNTFFYRNKMDFTFGYDKDFNFSLGLHMPKRRYDILNLDECFLESKFALTILKEVRSFALENKFKPRRYTNNTGFLKSLVIREGKRTGEVLVNLVTVEAVPEKFKNKLSNFVERLLALKPEGEEKEKKITTIYWSKIHNKRGEPKRTIETLLYGKEKLTEVMELEGGDKLYFDILPEAFFQVNTFQAEILYQQILRFAQKNKHNLVFDLFCGTGTIGLFLAKYCQKVMGIELNASAIKVAKENAKKNNIENIEFYEGAVQTAINDLTEDPSLIVVDPPRAGLTEKLIEKISEFKADELIYVSCNPSTLARDLAWLQEQGFILEEVQPVDMFPNTFHIETVSYLKRN